MATDLGALRERTAAGLDRYGLLPQTGTGVQIDVTAVIRRSGDLLLDGYLCDHNCTITYRGEPTGGHYNCPAAFSLNRGAIAASNAPAEVLLRGIEHVIAAGRAEQRRFLDEEFGRYVEAFRVPDDVAAWARERVAAETAEVALFGGSPEAHPEILDIVSALSAAGHDVHITMTGRRVMRAPSLLRNLAAAGIGVVALSIDDIGSPAELRRLLDLEPDDLYAAWRAIPRAHGQRQKVYEAVYTARLLRLLPEPRPRLLMNIAVHPGNVAAMSGMLALVTERLGPVMLNPFPLQSAFERRPAELGEAHVAELRGFVAAAIEEQHRAAAGRPSRWSLVPRLHYWLALEAALDGPEPGERVSGWGTWRCYSSAGSGRYIQIAGSGGAADSGARHAGGRVGCFWNESLAAPELPPVWDAEPELLADYLNDRPARAAAMDHPCAGCLFPRLVGDMVSLETGLAPALRGGYLNRRLRHLGF